MKILKKFDSYIKEDLEMMAEPATKPSTTPATPTVEPGTKPERRDRPTPIRRDRPAVEPDPQAKMKMDATEEDGTYIGTQMLQDLADALGTEVMDNAVQYEGKTINFYSETEKFHVDRKKFATVEEVVNYLTGGNSLKTQMVENDIKSFDNSSSEDEVEDLEDEFEDEDEEEIVRGRHIKEFENFIHDEFVDDSEKDEYGSEVDFGNEYQGEDEEDEYQYRVKSEKPEWMWNEDGEFDENEIEMSSKFMKDDEDFDDSDEFYNSEEICTDCDCNPCKCNSQEDGECVPCSESHITKKFNNFR